jgi:hypothetical protein
VLGAGGTAWAHAATCSSTDDEVSEISPEPAREQRLSLRRLRAPSGVGDDNGESEPECEDADDRPESTSEKSELSWLAAGEDGAGISSDSRSASDSSVGGGSASEDGKKLRNRCSAWYFGISTYS